MSEVGSRLTGWSSRRSCGCGRARRAGDAWIFVTRARGRQRRDPRSGGPPRGFGSVRVEATIGATTWRTSVFPNSDEAGTFALPLKKAVRTSEDLEIGDTTAVAAARGRRVNVRGEDWYAEELGAVRHVGVTFDDVDLTEATSSGAHFEDCVFRGCRFNSSTHTSTAFVGSHLPGLQLLRRHPRRLQAHRLGLRGLHAATAEGGRWRVAWRDDPGATLAKLDLTGLDLREADLSLSNLSEAVLRDARLDGAMLRESDLTGTDLRGAGLSGVDLTAAKLQGDPARPRGRRTAGRAVRRRRGHLRLRELPCPLGSARAVGGRSVASPHHLPGGFPMHRPTAACGRVARLGPDRRGGRSSCTRGRLRCATAAIGTGSPVRTHCGRGRQHHGRPRRHPRSLKGTARAHPLAHRHRGDRS